MYGSFGYCNPFRLADKTIKGAALQYPLQSPRWMGNVQSVEASGLCIYYTGLWVTIYREARGGQPRSPSGILHAPQSNASSAQGMTLLLKGTPRTLNAGSLVARPPARPAGRVVSEQNKPPAILVWRHSIDTKSRLKMGFKSLHVYPKH